MIVNLPTIERKLNDKNEVEVVKGNIAVDVDVSFNAHMKWEEHFAKTMQCDLSTYTERVQTWTKDINSAKVNFLGILKVLYCYVNSDKLPTFKDFCKLFDYSIAEEILNTLTKVLTEVGSSVSKN